MAQQDINFVKSSIGSHKKDVSVPLPRKICIWAGEIHDLSRVFSVAIKA